MSTRSQEMKNTTNAVKASALEKRVKGDKKSELKRVHKSDEYCSTCGANVSRTERYESNHRHGHSETVGGLNFG